ncbi:hypothetical protein CWB73_13565 [Pseudoalteromonas phenolica]|uniref:Uncharacterized protein n=2 Tax=Pseudoalteromonas phenolica TaxID=161398 RepID=A0A5S3YSP6_9GAMM|nr:hypothetical protein [Pseudoalteromonas phenolica]TMP79446.1 hypothetical protein CWB73_13565 [Pseudoalteromonas phenolica]
MDLQKNSQEKTLKKLLLSSLIALSLSACGGGGGDDKSEPQGIKNITYTALPSTSSADEGDTINLSLNTQGTGASDLKFTWSVKLDNQDVTFTGQGTDSISFTAPDVDKNSTIIINVSLDSSNTIGFRDQSTLISVTDLNPAPVEPPIVAPETPPTIELDLSNLNNGSTWIETQQLYVKTVLADSSYTTVETKVIRPLIIESTNTELANFTADYCGFEDILEIAPTAMFDPVQCSEGEGETVLTQQEDSFSVTKLCDGVVVAKSEFKKHSDDSVTRFGSLELTFDNYPDLKTDNNLCGLVATSTAKAFTANNVEIDQSVSSAIRLLTEYEGSPFELFFSTDTAPNRLFGSLDSFMSGGAYHAKLITEVYPEISDPVKSSSGTIIFEFGNTLSNINADFRFTLPVSNAPSEQVEGKFELIIE